MKEHPIPFNTPMVRAILEGRKTQTRRVVDPQPESTPFQVHGESTGDWFTPNLSYPKRGAMMSCRWKCPYGQTGDRLWVREAWNITHKSDLAPGEKIGKSQEDCFRDNGGFNCACADGVVYKADGVSFHPEHGKAIWRPSIHMFRWASRITLEVVNVRVERLLNIRGNDVLAEGLSFIPDQSEEYMRLEFASLWGSINGKSHPWDSNPWVWVIDFNLIGTHA